jgi:hypothetical protein
MNKLERLLPLLWLLFAFAVVAPTFAHLDNFASSYDWRLFETWLEAGRRSIIWYHQLPLWNPWTCGGQVYLANPQSLVATPTFLLVLIFGTALGAKLTLVAYYFCAFDGAYRLARDLKSSIVAAILAAILTGTGGWFALHFSEGHCTFFGAALFPYAMLFYRRAVADLYGHPAHLADKARIDWAWCIPLGAVAAWIVGDGGTSTPPMCIVILTTLATIDAVAHRSPRTFLPLLAAAAIGFLIGAVRVLPAMEFVLDHPRHLFESDANTPWDMLRNAYLWKGIEPVQGKRYWFHEYSWRLPYLTLPLIAWSLTVRRAWKMWIFIVVGGVIVAGSAFPYGPWWLLHHLPIFRDLRVPSRYQIMFAIGVPQLCAVALDDIRARVRWAWLRAGVTVLVLGACTVEGLWFDHERYERGLGNSPVFDTPSRLAPKGTRFYQVVGEWRTMMSNVFENHGAIGCDEEAPLQRALRLDEGDVPQARLEDAGAGRIEAITWTPNRVDVRVALMQPATVSVNENWNEHWRAQTSAGERVAVVRVGPKLERDRDGGRLGARAPAGNYVLSFVYRPRSFVVGLILTLFSFPLAIAGWVLLRRRRRVAG